MRTFTGRTLVVSGGSRGIGLAIALGAANHGGGKDRILDIFVDKP
jgi:NAD(P)-dependent dehydrogenase (short-subunit alcohol dehydrogenase family)